MRLLLESFLIPLFPLLFHESHLCHLAVPLFPTCPSMFTYLLPPFPTLRSLNDFTTEDIEKMNNVSFSDAEYTDKVLLVVNLASF